MGTHCAVTVDLPSRRKECCHLSQCSGYKRPLLQSTLQIQHWYHEVIHLKCYSLWEYTVRTLVKCAEVSVNYLAGICKICCLILMLHDTMRCWCVPAPWSCITFNTLLSYFSVLTRKFIVMGFLFCIILQETFHCIILGLIHLKWIGYLFTK